MTAPVLAATAWPTNAHMIEDVAPLYLADATYVLDPTYGRGVWWQRWQPPELTHHDIRLDGVDFRALPYEADTFDAAVYDPPYVSPGGRKTSTLGGAPRGPVTNERGATRRTREGSDFHDRYGLTDAPTSPAELQRLMDEGLAEVARVVKPRGYILMKNQDYVSSGRVWWGTFRTAEHAASIGLELVDRFEHLAGVRPQPAGRRQVHARRNLSTLFVFRVAK